MEASRWLRHLLHAPASRAFPPPAMQEIQAAIARGEARHGGEICFAVEARLPVRYLVGGRRVRARAENVFGELKLWDTDRGTGVLVYVLLGDHAVEIVPDRRLLERVPTGSWDAITALFAGHFSEDAWLRGALAGIEAIHELLARHVPPGPERKEGQSPGEAVLL